MSEKEEKCHKVFEIIGDKYGICVGVQLKPDHPNDFVNLCFKEVYEKDGEKWVKPDGARTMTLDEAAQLGLHLIECQYVFNQLKGEGKNVWEKANCLIRYPSS